MKRMCFCVLIDLNVIGTCFGVQIEVNVKKLIVDVKYCINLCSISLNLCTSAFYIGMHTVNLHCNCSCVLCVCLYAYIHTFFPLVWD